MVRKIVYIVTFTLLLQNISYSQYALLDKDSIYNTTVALKEVTVKSSKELHKLKSLPASVSLVSESKLMDNEIYSLKGLTSFIPNLFIPDYGSRLTSPIYIRGIGSRINSPSVGLYVDNVPYFDKSSFDFDFTEIERIEVLRGPQGTLYGRNSMGGIINVYTKSPELHNKNHLTISGGNYGYKKVGISHYNTFSNKFSYYLGASYIHKDGYFTNVYNNKEADEIDSYSFSGKLIYNINKNLKTILTVSYQKNDQAGYPYSLYNSETHLIDDVNYNEYSTYIRDMLSSSISIEYQKKNYLIRAITSHQYVDDNQDIDQDFTPSTLFIVNQKQKQHMLSQELSIKSNGKSNYKWITGLFGFWQQIDKDVAVNYGQDAVTKYKLPGVLVKNKKYNTPTVGAAIFHQSTIDNILIKKLSFTAGIRVDYEKAEQDYYYSKTISNPTTVMDTCSYLEFWEVLPKLSLRYMFKDNSFIYSTISKGYKTGGFNSTFERKEDREFDPEKSWNYEVGIKSSFFKNRLYISVAGFFIDWKDQQIYQTVPSGQGSMLKNAGKSESKGYELELRAIPFKNLQTDISYGYTKARFTSHKVNDTKDYTGNNIPYVPNQTLSANITYTKNINSKILDIIKINGLYKGIGEHYWNEANSFKQGFYYTIDGKISLIKKNFSIELWGKNITDSEYAAFWFSSLGNDYIQKGKPGNFGINIKYTF